MSSKSYVDVETLARLTNGSLSFKGSQITLTLPADVTVNLVKRVPVFIVYGTALAYEKGEVHFSDDIYGHEARLAVALAKGYPYP